MEGDGELRLTQASTALIAAGMTPLNTMTIDDLLAHLRQQNGPTHADDFGTRARIGLRCLWRIKGRASCRFPV